MSGFIEAAFTMPTTVFSVLLILVVLYWLTVILGVLDLGIFDGLFDVADGALDSAASAAEGLAEGVAEGLAEGAGEHHGCLGLAGVPGSIIGTALVVFAWGFSFGGSKLLPGVASGMMAVVGLGLGAFVLSMGATAVALRPLRKAFVLPPVTGREDLVGRTCRITTLRVDEKFGQAEVIDEGAAILIQARSGEPNDLGRGSEALIFQYDPGREVFLVTPLGARAAEATKRPEDSG
ncbi:MAG: hypothetical protein AAF657_24295 [Acidobacteriota bacterium]